METKTTKNSARRPYGWWFKSHDACLDCSSWLHSTLSELNEKTWAMLRMIEEDADTFTERVEMYYERRPQLVGFIEDFYREQRSLVEQIDHLRRQAHVCSRCYNKSPFPYSCHPRKGVSFPYSDEDDSTSDVIHEDELELGEEFASMDVKLEKTIQEIERLREENIICNQRITEKGRMVQGIQEKLSESEDMIVELMRENETLRAEIMKMNLILKRREVERDRMEANFKAEIETLNNQLAEKDEEKREIIKIMGETAHNEMNTKDEEKREVIRQLSLALELVKSDNVILKKRLASKRWWFFNGPIK